MKTMLLLIGLAVFSLSLSEAPVVANETPFNINNYDWLVGSWEGDGFGGISHESWEKPVKGTMMGMYRHISNGEVAFYEFMLLDETGIRLKHFNPDLTGWEEKDDMMKFKMIRSSKDKIEMEGLSYERISDSEIEIQLVMDQGSETHTEIFSMRKITP
ncbi:MAG: DUF6265 family protein [Gracilimonas sp.]